MTKIFNFFKKKKKKINFSWLNDDLLVERNDYESATCIDERK